MDLIDRALVIIKPKQPYLDWAKSLPDPTADLTLDELRRDCTALLIPEFEDDDRTEAFIRDIYPPIFEMELEAWERDRRRWPRQRDYLTFREWFEVELHSVVLDSAEDEITKEEYQLRIHQRGVSVHLRSGNGLEFTAEKIRIQLNELGASTLFIEPGSPWENGYVESFNEKLRDELLNREIFYTREEARVLSEGWRQEYNTVRPHSALGYRPPAPEVRQMPVLAGSLLGKSGVTLT